MTEQLEQRLRSQLPHVADSLSTPSTGSVTHATVRHRWAPRVALLGLVGLLATGAVLLGQRADDSAPQTLVAAPLASNGTAIEEPAAPPGDLPPRAEVPTAMDETSPEPALVTILVFSGRPNPTWQLTADQDAQLQLAVDQLTVTSSANQPDSTLGFNGFVVEDFRSDSHQGSLTVSETVVACECYPDGSTILLADPNGSVLRLLAVWALEQPLDAAVTSIISEHH